MIALAIICLLLAAALVVGVVATGTSQEVVFSSTVGNVTTQPVWVFLAGVAATLLVLIGLSFLGKGTRRRMGQRREMRRLRRAEQERAEAERLAAARDTEARHAGEGRAVPVESRDGVTTEAGVRDSTVPPDRAAAYDAPDRQLVREPRPTATLDETGTSEPARHRDV